MPTSPAVRTWSFTCMGGTYLFLIISSLSHMKPALCLQISIYLDSPYDLKRSKYQNKDLGCEWVQKQQKQYSLKKKYFNWIELHHLPLSFSTPNPIHVPILKLRASFYYFYICICICTWCICILVCIRQHIKGLSVGEKLLFRLPAGTLLLKEVSKYIFIGMQSEALV